MLYSKFVSGPQGALRGLGGGLVPPLSLPGSRSLRVPVPFWLKRFAFQVAPGGSSDLSVWYQNNVDVISLIGTQRRSGTTTRRGAPALGHIVPAMAGAQANSAGSGANGAGAQRGPGQAQPGGTPFEVMAWAREGEEHLFWRPCVDCGLRTGCFCDGCFASTRLPLETWKAGQRTPLCTDCDRRHGGLCHYCRGLSWATPPTRGPGRPGGR